MPTLELKSSLQPTLTLDVVQTYRDYVVPSYAQSMVLTRGQGAYVWDDAGKKYLDFGGGIAVNGLGHCHPEISRVLFEQSQTLVHVSNLFYHPNQALLAEKIVKLTGPGKAFFCNSGAEANEMLYKLARKFGHDTGRYEVITCVNSFHGRTLGGIAATGQDKIKKGFEPIIPGFVHVPFNDLAAVEQAITPLTSAVLIEGVQGEGGITPATPEFLLGLRKLCDKRGLLLLMDAVQCGMFRTGTFQSYTRILEHIPEGQDFRPDAISMAKSLGNGYPIGAVWIAKPYCELFTAGTHGTTYGGSALGSAVALKVIEIMERDHLADNIRKQGDKIFKALLRHIATHPPILKDVRGFGGLLGLVLKASPAIVAADLRAAGLLVVPAGTDVIRLLPPLNITDAEVDEALAILTRYL